MRVSPMAKAIVAAIGAIVGIVVPVVTQSDVLSSADFIQMAVGVVTAIAVYVWPNRANTAPPTLTEHHGAHERPEV